MVLSDELKELGASSLDVDAWKRPYTAWSTRTTELPRSNGASTAASVSGSGTQSLKSYISQIKLGMESRDLQVDPHAAEEVTTNVTELFSTKVADKYERVKRLESSLCGLQSNVESKRSNILEEIYQKINNLETKIAESETQERRTYNETNKKIDVIQRSVATANAKHEADIKDAIAKMEAVYQRFNDTLSAEKEHWKKAEREAFNEITSNIKNIRDELEDMKKAKTHVSTYLRKYIDVELPQLKTRINAAGEDIANMEKTIAANTNEDLLALAAFIKQEASQLHEIKRTVLIEVAKNADVAKAQLAKVSKPRPRKACQNNMETQECEERKHMQQRMVTLMEETLKRLGSPL